jgi:hypothetical protein
MANPALWGFGLAAVGLIAAGVWLKMEEGAPPGNAGARPAEPVPVVSPADPATGAEPRTTPPLPPKPEPAPRVGDQGAATGPADATLPARAAPGGSLPRLVSTLRDRGRDAASGVRQAPP